MWRDLYGNVGIDGELKEPSVLLPIKERVFLVEKRVNRLKGRLDKLEKDLGRELPDV